MKNENRFIQADEFGRRVLIVMKNKNITLDELHEKINSKLGYTITKNNLSIYLKRVPNVHFLFVLSKALQVSSDCLIGLSDAELSTADGLIYDYASKRYEKYRGEYLLYFCPTVSSRANRYHTASISFEGNADNSVRMNVTTDEGHPKIYYGKLILSNNYQTGYISLCDENIGEVVYLTFCDPSFNNPNTHVEFLIGLMLSVSGGDLKRAPVASRFILSKDMVPKEKHGDTLLANLMLNTKYINIEKSALKEAIDGLINNSQSEVSCDTNKVRINGINLNPNKGAEILGRLEQAFSKQEFFRIEEAYILNTIKHDCKLTDLETTKLINALRLNSYCVTNNKLNRSLDSRIYLTVKDDLIKRDRESDNNQSSTPQE